MKKLLFILVAFAGVASVHAQEGKSKSLEPGKSLTVQEANQLNGNAQPVMKNGKPYAQWVAEEKAKRKAEPATTASAKEQLIAINASDVRPAPARPQPEMPKKENDGYSKPATVPTITEAAVVKQDVPAPEVPSSLRIAEAKEWTGHAVGGEKATAADVAMPKSDPGQPLNGEDLSAVKTAVKPAAEKPAKRSHSEIEKAKQLQEQTAKVKVANEKEAAAASSTAPELKVETATENAAPVAPSSKPPVAPPAGKQE